MPRKQRAVWRTLAQALHIADRVFDSISSPSAAARARPFTMMLGGARGAAAAASLVLLATAPQFPAVVCGGLLGVVVLAALAWERDELRDLRRRLHVRAGLAT
jgi:hypothetical protein